jgi:DNA-binding XRE family transcriptional regulator
LLSVSRQTVNAIETRKYDPSLPLAFEVSRIFGQRIEAVFLPDSSLAAGKEWPAFAHCRRRRPPPRDTTG